MLSNVFGQDEVKWTFDYDNQSNKVLFKAELKQHWHLYSQFIDENLGPIPTTFEFSENEHVRLVGSVKENIVQTVYDENFGGSLDIIEGKAVFSQEVILERPTTLKGSVLFMLCDHNGCLPPDVVEFEIEMN
jgi:thiol:disulfide interchange protein DsbD